MLTNWILKLELKHLIVWRNFFSEIVNLKLAVQRLAMSKPWFGLKWPDYYSHIVFSKIETNATKTDRAADMPVGLVVRALASEGGGPGSIPAGVQFFISFAFYLNDKAVSEPTSLPFLEILGTVRLLKFH